MTADYNKVKVNSIDKQIKASEGGGDIDKKEPRKVVVSGEVTKVKRGLLERIVASMVGPEGIKSVASMVGHEVVAPAIKSIVADSVTSGINALIYGPEGRNRKGSRYGGSYSRYGNNQRTNYSQASRYAPTDDAPEDVVVRRQGFTTSDYLIGSRDEANLVLENLEDSLNDFNQVSVADFKESIGQITEFTDNNFGWRDTTDFRIQAYRGKFVIISPRPTKL